MHPELKVSPYGKIVVWDLAKRDQVAVYDTGERLNVVSTVNESIEKAGSMKPRYDPTKDNELANATESEYESDGESLGYMLKGKKKKSKKQMRKERKKLLSVEK
ncbi:unnamed protein product [Ambrosiozyma monospora]|uniref:Unnamed protein product n=1 Tax=Ambrosiozyma monospora TaxID=43982 RepID=A0A9W6Z2C7_AMBMO|nr:unnamed protein product [Ambrosiozyma monospora]